MNKEVKIFNPSVAEANKIVEQYKNLTIESVEDKDGYLAVYNGIQELKKLRGDITKFGKKEREESLAYQREVLRQEKELLGIITPVEDDLKAERAKIDEAVKKDERKVLLPSRIKMLEDVNVKMAEDEILSLDEKQFSEMYSLRKQEFDDEQERIRMEEENRKKREDEIKEAERVSALRAKEEAERKAKEELEKVEREKQAEIDKMKREQEEKEKDEIDRIEKEKREKEEAERNVKYQEWLTKNGYSENTKENFLIQKNGNEYVLYKKLDVINL